MTTLSQPDEQILLALSRMYYLTSEQIRRRFYGQSLTYVQKRMRGLEAAGYVFSIKPQLFGRGAAPYVYALDTAGIRLLGIDRRTPRDDDKPYHSLFMRHTLSVNDVLIALELCQGRVSLREYQHEKDLARIVAPLKPDAWLSLNVDGEERVYLLEVDMGTEASKQWREKTRKLLAYILSPQKRAEIFGSQLLWGIIVVADTTEQLERIGTWIQAELVQQRLPSLSEAFCFTTLADATSTAWLTAHL